MDCGEAEELIPAYALNALSQQEATLLEEHLDSCHWCVALLREHVQVAAALAQAADRVQPPQDLRERTMRAARAPLRQAQTSRRPFFAPKHLVQAAAASIVILLLAGVLAIGFRMSDQIDDLQQENFELVGRMSDQINDLQQENSELVGRVSALALEEGKLHDMLTEQRYMSYFAASADKQVFLQGGEGVPTAQGMLVIAAQGGTGLLMAKGLEPSWGEEAYHVWLSKNGQRVTVGRLAVDDTGWGILTLWPEQPITLFQQVWVTEGPVLGSDTPGGSTVLWGTIVSR